MFEFDIFFIYLMISSLIILGATSLALTIQVFKSRQEITQLSSELSNHLEPQSILKLLKAQEDSFNQALILSESNITNSLENFSATLKDLIDAYDEGINKVHQVPTQLFQTHNAATDDIKKAIGLIKAGHKTTDLQTQFDIHPEVAAEIMALYENSA